jgi:hypothetical protein
MNDSDELNERQRKVVQGVAIGLSPQEAARRAGFSLSYAKKASRLLKIPAVAKAIEAIRSEARREAVYGIQEHVKELDAAIVAAYSHKAMMAVSRLLRDKGECYGLYINRFQEVPIDLKGSLEAARLRVINPRSLLPEQGEPGESDDEKAAKWPPGHA